MANTHPIITDGQVVLVGKTTNSISIRWTKATDNESPQSQLLYTVTWCVSPYVWDNNIRKIGDRKFDNNSYTIEGLVPNTTYDIYIYVRDPQGAESVYAKKTVTTLPVGVPNTAPVLPNKVVVARNISLTGVELNWQKATDKETPQSELRYVITYSPGPAYADQNRKQTAFMTDVTSFKLTGLLPHTSYKIVVWAYDGKSYSAYTPIYITTEDTSVKPGATEIDTLVNGYPCFDIEDGYRSRPSLPQNDDSVGVWLRGRRNPSDNIWFSVTDKINHQLIYPGNIILADKNKKFLSNMVEIPFKAEERKSLNFDALYSNELPKDQASISNFTRAGVNQFVAKCLTNFKNSKHDLASSTHWEYACSDNYEGINLGGTIKAVTFNASIGRNKTVTVASFKQTMYTVSLDNDLAYASDIFSNKLDIKKFKDQCTKYGSVGSPCIIDAVRYGRVVTLWAIQEGNEPASLSVDNMFNIKVSCTNKTTRYSIKVYGGVAGDSQFELSNSDSVNTVQSALKNLMKESSKIGMEGAMPIEYTMKFLSDLRKNVVWRNYEWYKTYVDRICFKVSENNKGASMKVYVNALTYDTKGNVTKYYKWESPKKGLDYLFYIPPKSLCIDIKVDVTGAADKRDFNIMLPCIPYDSIVAPDKDGDWMFKVNIYGTTIFDTKNFSCTPYQPGTYLSTSNGFWMNKFSDSPLRYFDGKKVSEQTVLNYYYTWFINKRAKESCIKVGSSISGPNGFRPDR